MEKTAGHGVLEPRGFYSVPHPPSADDVVSDAQPRATQNFFEVLSVHSGNQKPKLVKTAANRRSILINIKRNTKTNHTSAKFISI